MIVVSSPPFLKSRCSGLQRALQEDLICLYETSRTVSQVRTPGLYIHSRPRGAVGSDTFISAACSPCAMDLIRTTPPCASWRRPPTWKPILLRSCSRSLAPWVRTPRLSYASRHLRATSSRCCLGCVESRLWTSVARCLCCIESNVGRTT